MIDSERSRGNMELSVDCQIFVDQLDALAQGRLSEERTRRLRLHADTCPDCAMTLKLREHLTGPTLQALEAQVPDSLVTSVWAGIQAGGDGVQHPVADIRPRFGWLVPLMAAASLALLFSTGLLMARAVRLTNERTALTQQVAEQQRWMAALGSEGGIDPVARTAALAGRSPFTRALSRTENISVAHLQRLLERLPPDRVILTRAQSDELLRGRALATWPLLREALSQVAGGAGVRAHQLVRALEAMDVNQEATVSTADLVDLLS